jgi:GTP-binding protein
MSEQRGRIPKADIINARFLKSLPKWSDKDLELLPQVCFAGRSNVGKSSLINALVNQTALARTSSTPGRTQALVVFHAQLRKEACPPIPFHLVDLPGYGYAKVPLEMRSSWGPMMNGYFRGNQRIACCVMLLDIRRDPSDIDFELMEMMDEHGTPIMPVVTKVDKVPKTQRARELKRVAATLQLDDWRDLRPASATEKLGVPELLAELYDVVAEWGSEPEE